MPANRTITAADNVGRVCGCENCIAAGVGTERMRRIPGEDGKPMWIHAERLRDWLKAYRVARQAFQNFGKPRSM